MIYIVTERHLSRTPVSHDGAQRTPQLLAYPRKIDIGTFLASDSPHTPVDKGSPFDISYQLFFQIKSISDKTHRIYVLFSLRFTVSALRLPLWKVPRPSFCIVKIFIYIYFFLTL